MKTSYQALIHCSGEIRMHPVEGALLDRMERNRYRVPSDFPRRDFNEHGIQPKFSTVAFDARYYLPGCTPPMLYKRWESMEDFAQDAKHQLLTYGSREYPNKTKTEILGLYYEEFLPHATTIAEELRWAIRRTAQLVNCEPPACGAEYNTRDASSIFRQISDYC